LGAREFIKKPFSPEEFAIRLNKMISDSETTKGVKSGKGADKETPEYMDEPGASTRIKGKTDEDIERLVDDLMKPLKET
jgi:DNA-binding response OmpR family regulator